MSDTNRIPELQPWNIPAGLTRLRMKCDLCETPSNLFLIIEDTNLSVYMNLVQEGFRRRFPTVCTDCADKKPEIEAAYQQLAKPDHPVKCLDGVFGEI